MGKKEIGEKIRYYRKQKGMTQLEVANLLGVTEFTVSKIENGKWISLSMILRLAEILGFEIELKST
jgi:transcriptional regulator with XRE-family HTH domain